MDFTNLLPLGYALIRVQELYDTIVFGICISFHHGVMEAQAKHS